MSMQASVAIYTVVHISKMPYSLPAHAQGRLLYHLKINKNLHFRLDSDTNKNGRKKSTKADSYSNLARSVSSRPLLICGCSSVEEGWTDNQCLLGNTPNPFTLVKGATPGDIFLCCKSCCRHRESCRDA